MVFTARIEREHLSDGQPIYVALCLELDVASQGPTVEEAKTNLTEALSLFLETASPHELERHLPQGKADEVFITRIEVPLGETAGLIGVGRL